MGEDGRIFSTSDSQLVEKRVFNIKGEMLAGVRGSKGGKFPMMCMFFLCKLPLSVFRGTRHNRVQGRRRVHVDYLFITILTHPLRAMRRMYMKTPDDFVPCILHCLHPRIALDHLRCSNI